MTVAQILQTLVEAKQKFENPQVDFDEASLLEILLQVAPTLSEASGFTRLQPEFKKAVDLYHELESKIAQHDSINWDELLNYTIHY